jgi:hypothetical protein
MVSHAVVFPNFGGGERGTQRRFGSRWTIDSLFSIEIASIPKYDDCSIEVHQV